MPRRARLVLPGMPLHIVQRSHNRQRCFHVRSDCIVYLDKLREHAATAGCAIHAYVLMTNHVHILTSFEDTRAPSRLMRMLGQQYSAYLNKRLGRTGTTWEGRYWSCPVPTEKYLFICQRYIELNPVRAGMVDQQDRYRWSSYRGNAGLSDDHLLRPHELYERLGPSDEDRQQHYRKLFDQDLTQAELTQMREGLKDALPPECIARPPDRPGKTKKR